MKILILCTGNSCRSQMAEGFLQSFNSKLRVKSAGTEPAAEVHPKAIKAMAEVGIDISSHKPKLADEFINEAWDFVITVCDHANETCPTFLGKVENRLHIGFDDPAKATGTEEEIMAEFRKIRNEIHEKFYDFYKNTVEPKMS